MHLLCKPLGRWTYPQVCTLAGESRLSLRGNRFDTWRSHAAPPINNVPVEILCKIFSDALRFPPSSLVSSHLALHRSNIALLNLTAVCRYWRSAALEDATLWTSIAFSTSVWSTIQCAALFLVRSKEVVLSVYIMDSGYPRDRETVRSCEELLRAIVNQSHRFSTCEFSSTSPSFWNHWSFPAPNLRKLTVQGYGTGAPLIFHGQVPLLESVTLLHYFPWPLGNCLSLRKADLRNRSRNVSLALLLDALRGCEVLEELALHGYAHLANEVSRPAPVPLPRLLKVDFFSCDSALILEHLEPRSPECSVTIFDLNPGQDILRSLPRDQSRVPPYLQGITELRVVLHSYSSQYYIAGNRENGSVALYIAVCGVDHQSRWAWVRASIGAIASFSHFSSTRKLTLSTDIPVISWDMWLPNLNHLQDLTVSCPRSEGLLHGLLGSSPQTGLPSCPSLQSLALYRCGGCAIVDGLGLIKFVVSRYSAGRPLRQLNLHKGDWDRIQQLDSSWAALAHSQCACSRQEYL